MSNGRTVEDNKATQEKNLQAQFEKLRSEVSNITSTLTDLGANKFDKAKNKTEKLYNSAKESGEEVVSQAQNSMKNFEEALSRCVRKNPNKSVLVAAGFGFALAQLFCR
ncbi:DUF883 family protein [Bartonella sp. CB178]|uniref:DUF883 family protein n=1 Tax=Bartonella sp. CB178 TaxID=3112255 RepID=UPI00300DF42E